MQSQRNHIDRVILIVVLLLDGSERCGGLQRFVEMGVQKYEKRQAGW